MGPLPPMLASRIRPGHSPVGLALIALAVLLQAGCAVPTTQVGQISRGALLAEQETQQRYVLEMRLKQQARLQAVAYPLLESAGPICGNDVVRRAGISYANAPSFAKDAREAARALGFTDTVNVTQVLPGSGAEQAGLRKGDRLLAIDGTAVPVGPTAVRDLGAWMAKRERSLPSAVSVTYRRDTTLATVKVPTEAVCSYHVIAVPMDELNAFADGENVFVTTAMLRFAADDAELSTVVGHEIGHNAMHHMDATKRNMALGMLFGAIVDVVAAANGVNTQGDFTNEFGKMGAMVFSQDFEREADYVGLYIVARSGRSVHDAADLWRHMAAENPSSIKFASSHPTTAERFLRLKQFAAEIESKQTAGLALLPEMKRPGPSVANPVGQVLAARGKRQTSCGMGVCTTTAAAAMRAPSEEQRPPTQPTPAQVSKATVSSPPQAADVQRLRAPAESPVTPSPTANDAVPVRVVVRVPDWVVGSFLSVRDYPIHIVGPGQDSTIVRTDETGAATFMLRPGHYHIIPQRDDAVAAHQRYEWDVQFDITGSAGVIELTAANGTRRGRR